MRSLVGSPSFRSAPGGSGGPARPYGPVLLVNPPETSWFTYPSLALLYLGGALEAAGYHVEILDGNAGTDLRHHLARRLNAVQSVRNTGEGRPVVGFTANVTTWHTVRRLCRFTRRRAPEALIVVGGPHPTSVPEATLTPDVDVVVLGEGEETLVELLSGRPWGEVPGLAYREDGEVKVSERPPPEDLDRMPLPAWHLVDLRRYRHPWRRPLGSLVTSRGCPYRCLNCTKAVHGARYRTQSVSRVLQEVEHLVTRVGVREIHVWDDNFTLQPERVKEICRGFIGGGWSRRVRFALANGVRGDIDDVEMFRLLARANFYYVGIAFESGNQEVVRRLGKELDLARARETVDLARRVGLRVGAYFMLGLPFETVGEMEETIRFACSLPVDHCYFSMSLPLPGTGLYDIVAREGRFLVDLIHGSGSVSRGTADGYVGAALAPPRGQGAASSAPTSARRSENRRGRRPTPGQKVPFFESGKAVFEMPHFRAEEVERMFRRAHRRFYLRPRQVLRTTAALLRSGDGLGFAFRSLLRLAARGRRL